MAVVINEFEMVPAEPRREQEAGEEKTREEKLPPSKCEIERLVDRQISRCERVWAH